MNVGLGQSIDPTTAAAMESLAPPPPTVSMEDLASWLAPAFGVVGSGIAAGQAVYDSGQNISQLVASQDNDENPTLEIPTWLWIAAAVAGAVLTVAIVKSLTER
jgi:hypothetical protein